MWIISILYKFTRPKNTLPSLFNMKFGKIFTRSNQFLPDSARQSDIFCIHWSSMRSPKHRILVKSLQSNAFLNLHLYSVYMAKFLVRFSFPQDTAYETSRYSEDYNSFQIYSLFLDHYKDSKLAKCVACPLDSSYKEGSTS